MHSIYYFRYLAIMKYEFYSWFLFCRKKLIYFYMSIPTVSECSELTGGRLNKKDGLTRYGDSHVKDKTS